MKKFDWIKQFFDVKKENDEWNSISDFIPNEFDTYFLIHWNVGIVENFPFENYPEENITIEEINKRIKIEREYNLFFNPKEDELFKKTTLKEIADKFNLKYSYNLLNQIKETPAIKVFEESSIKNLEFGISQIAKNEKVNMYVEDIFRYPIDEKPKQEIENLSIEDYFKWQEVFYFDYCTYLFPDNRKWCITTSEDLPMFICCKSEIVSEVKNTFNLELFTVDYSDELY